MSEQRIPVFLALQGGGSHGAMSWGVIDHVLTRDDIEIVGISGTSAGAMNGAVLAAGLAEGGREQARERLASFWGAITDAAANSMLRRSPIDRWMGNWSLDNSPGYQWLDLMTRVVSPYALNPFNVNPLERILKQIVNFEALNHDRAVPLYVTATNVESGQARVFTQPDLGPKELLASAAIPTMFQAVEIEGEYFWDGGYVGNPALFPLIDSDRAGDILIVQTNPFRRTGRPTTAREILNRVNEISFNSSLLKELRVSLLLRHLIENGRLTHDRFQETRLHLVHADGELSQLSPSSKLNVEQAYIEYLFDLGRDRAKGWFKKNRAFIGQASTFDPDGLLEGKVKPQTLAGTP